MATGRPVGASTTPLEIHVHPQRLMIGTRGVGVDACRLHPARQCSRNKAEIDSLAVVGCHAFIFSVPGSDPGICSHYWFYRDS